MKKYGVMLLALLVCGAVKATQDATLTQREVRDPRQLETILEANATDAETRLAAAEAGTSITLTSNKVFIGSSVNKASAQTLSGLFTIAIDGSASATTSGLAVTNATATAVVTPQAPATVTPAITVTAQRPGAQTPTITVAKQVGAVTATAVITPQTVSLTDTNGVTAIVWTNATCAVTIVGGDAVMTNATAVSSALLDYPTNATATCSALPDFATNATAVVTVTKETATFVKP